MEGAERKNEQAEELARGDPCPGAFFFDEKLKALSIFLNGGNNGRKGKMKAHHVFWYTPKTGCLRGVMENFKASLTSNSGSASD